MRAKQSKSEERRRKMIYRQKRTDKKIAEDREKDKQAEYYNYYINIILCLLSSPQIATKCDPKK